MRHQKVQLCLAFGGVRQGRDQHVDPSARQYIDPFRGQYAYLSNYSGGLHIVDLAQIDSNSLSEVAYFDTYQQGNPLSYAGQWANYPFFDSGIVLASDGRYGLFVLQPTGIVTAGESGAAPSSSVPSVSQSRPR